MKKLVPEIVVIILVILPLIYFLKVYPLLPPVIPTHFGFDGKPNGYSDKQTMIWIILSTSLISAASYLLIKFLPRIDPKKTAGMAGDKLQNIAMAVVALLSAVMISILYTSIHGSLSFSHLFNPIMGIFFIVVGNLMYSIKPNYFVGVRVPWTLENEDNWRATHRMTSILWVIGGILITVCTLVLPEHNSEYFFMISTLILALGPIIYSFIYFRKHRAIL
jgi:uncharacterized membrane protein